MPLGAPIGKYALGQLSAIERAVMAAPRTICLVAGRARDPNLIGRRAPDQYLIAAQFDRDTETCRDWPMAA